MAQFWHTRGTEAPIKWRNFGTLLPMTRKSSRVIIVPSKKGSSTEGPFSYLNEGVKTMKFCPYCGKDLLDSDVVFCAHCGKKLPPHEAGLTEPLNQEMRPEEAAPEPEKKKRAKAQKPVKVEAEPVDDGYDGYYNDVEPPDTDRVREGLDKELIKKIVLLGVGVLLIISLCVVMMYVL